jgi:hypothetical protein
VYALVAHHAMPAWVQEFNRAFDVRSPQFEVRIMPAFYMDISNDPFDRLRAGRRAARAIRIATVWSAAALLAVVITWPLASGIGYLGRTENNGDARFAVWNVTWVANALLTDPTRVYDANIYYPHRHALAFSEANLGAGTIALPVWALTRNPFTAHNIVLLFAFASSAVATFYLARYLTRDAGAAWTAAIAYASCPYLFSHTAHIQLLLGGGIPLSLLLMHRLVDAPSMKRGAILGVALAGQALFCAYYGIFAGLMVGFSAFFYAASRRYWTSTRYWIAIAVAAFVSIAIVAPFFLPYLEIQRETGFGRSLDDARTYSATWISYLASSARAHRWMLPTLNELGGWNGEVLFPGFVALALAFCGVVSAASRQTDQVAQPVRNRESVLLYGSLAVLAFWTSLGPAAGLYSVFYKLIPVFSFLRAPGRTGLVVMLCLAVLAAFGVRALSQKARGRGPVAITLAAAGLVFADLLQIPFDWRAASPINSLYNRLAELPRGAVAEFPFYDQRPDYHIHTIYMLNSTAHWQPLVNGYSDHIPQDFRRLAVRLASFPSRDAFDALQERRVRYITVHLDRYGHRAIADIERRLEAFAENLRLIAGDARMRIYEVVEFPR